MRAVILCAVLLGPAAYAASVPDTLAQQSALFERCVHARGASAKVCQREYTDWVLAHIDAPTARRVHK